MNEILKIKGDINIIEANYMNELDLIPSELDNSELTIVEASGEVYLHKDEGTVKGNGSVVYRRTLGRNVELYAFVG